MNVKSRVKKLEREASTIGEKSWAVVEVSEGEVEQEKIAAYCTEHGYNEDELNWWIVIEVDARNHRGL
jgi:hypothetical protein